MKAMLSRPSLGYIVLGLALIFLIIGALRGEVLIVLKQATKVCLECVGIG